jgi:hypothetical protein
LEKVSNLLKIFRRILSLFVMAFIKQHKNRHLRKIIADFPVTFHSAYRLIQLTRRYRFYMMTIDRIINNFLTEVTGAWWCPWSSKPAWGREGPGWVRFPFASAIYRKQKIKNIFCTYLADVRNVKIMEML